MNLDQFSAFVLMRTLRSIYQHKGVYTVFVYNFDGFRSDNLQPVGLSLMEIETTVGFSSFIDKSSHKLSHVFCV